jgi:tRNA(fMet)-specific endonuclease VapC
MTGSSCLLDTVILIGYLRGKQNIRQNLVSRTPYLSSISIGELYVGALRSHSTTNELQKITRLMTFANILVCDADTAECYGQIKHALWRKGRPIPENDIWIAATALQYELPLVSNDAHFGEIDGLDVEQW